MGFFDFLKKNKQDDADYVVPRDSQERWCLDTCSIWCASVGGDASKLGGRFSKKSSIQVLRRDWAITVTNDPNCARNFIEQDIRPILDNKSGEASELSWNYSLCAQLLCLAYSAEMITRSQYNTLFAELASNYQANFTSWEHMVEQYFVGYAEATGNLTGVENRKEIYKKLIMESSPNFKMDWKLSFREWEYNY